MTFYRRPPRQSELGPDFACEPDLTPMPSDVPERAAVPPAGPVGYVRRPGLAALLERGLGTLDRLFDRAYGYIRQYY